MKRQKFRAQRPPDREFPEIVYSAGHYAYMAPDLTQHPELRRRILFVLSGEPSGTLTATAALNRIYRGFDWTPKDHEPFPSAANNEPRWHKRTTTQYSRMVREGLAHPSPHQHWSLTPTGLGITSTEDDALGLERARRARMWEELRAKGGPTEVRPQLVNELGFHSGQRGIYADKTRTVSVVSPAGIALTFLHTGTSYDDELTETGVVYHFPQTKDKPRDRSEIEAARAAFTFGMPVFVNTTAERGTKTVYRGYIEDFSDDLKALLVTFTNDELLPNSAVEDPFSTTDDSLNGAAQALRATRPNQKRFAFAVLARYKERCAVCPTAVPGLVQAAHLVPKKNKGSDDARNGLAICANHHLALDRGYWGINPQTLAIEVSRKGPGASQLGITVQTLHHLPARPHKNALEQAWRTWQGHALNT
ncbi:HNH endonuclease [Arthrobacter sp. Leaf234]|uniref:HNH endonuclease n=1 Tax=Arthrobacter sp. Leaf234 TaxID=1736303 RepID=UPI00138F84B2|nr:HNH endonuclease [Arthrobacter sp. Leaf234]